MDLNLKNKVAVVCGSTQGLGLASAQELALLGCTIILFARNESKLKDAVLSLNKDNKQKHSYLVADFTDSELVNKVITDFVNNSGHADILINNTGGPAGGAALTANVKDFVKAFESHLLCNHYLVQALVPGMKKNNWGRIINVISTSVKIPITGLGVSNTIRAAVANWAKTLASELGPFGITVNNVLPGFTQTSRADYVIKNKAAASGKTEDDIMEELVKEIPVGRIGKPEEFGSAVAFLCSPAAAYINGINLAVDGGRLGCL